MARVNRDTLVAIFLLVICGVFLVASFEIREPDYGQLSPAALARRRYSPTVLWEILQLRAIARFDSPHSHFRRRTSCVLRMVNLSWAIFASFIRDKECLNCPRLASAAFYSLSSVSRFWSCRPLILNHVVH